MIFKKVELKDRQKLETYFLKNNALNYSAYNFSNIFIYRDIIKYEYAEFGDTLLIYSRQENIFYLPLQIDGKLISFEKFVYINSLLLKHFKDYRYLLVPELFIKNNFDDLSKSFKFKTNEEYFDYVYLSENLANLSGRKYHKKRNLIAQFETLYPNYSFNEISSDDFDDCFRLAKIWCKYKNCEDIGFTHENFAFKEAIMYFRELNFEGIKLVYNSQIIAFSIFTKLNESTYINNFEKYHPDFKGSSQMINKLTASYLLDKAKYINREQDLGIEGLRKAKKSYLPEESIGKVYEISC